MMTLQRFFSFYNGEYFDIRTDSNIRLHEWQDIGLFFDEILHDIETNQYQYTFEEFYYGIISNMDQQKGRHLYTYDYWSERSKRYFI